MCECVRVGCAQWEGDWCSVGAGECRIAEEERQSCCESAETCVRMHGEMTYVCMCLHADN